MSQLLSTFAPASNRLSLLLIAVLVPAVSLYSSLPSPVGLTTLLVPCALLILNFFAAIVQRRILVNKPFLLVFHISLIVLVIELLIAQLTYLKGTVEVGVGEDFSGHLENVEAGPLHDLRLKPGAFTNLGFDISYHEGIQRDATTNRIRLNESGRIVTIGDHTPLILDHYRFYTSHNKGYAPVFTWYPADGSASNRGSVHLPAYPTHEHEQAREWVVPGSTRKIWTMLVIEEELLPENRAFNFRIPDRHHLVIRFDERRELLKPGGRIVLAEGTLTYDALSTWMGYSVDYDWTRPWLMATCLVALFSLALHYVIATSRA